MRVFGVLGLPLPCDLGINLGFRDITSIFATKSHIGQKADMRQPPQGLYRDVRLPLAGRGLCETVGFGPFF
jgi:hypothetical protein